MSDTMYVNDDGAKTVLEAQLGIAASKFATGNLHLFSNNITVSDSTLLSAFTEAAFPGYAAIAIGSGDWNAVTVATHVANTTPTAAFSFVCTGGGPSESEYGWYWTDSTDTYLLACCNFASGPYVMLNNGDTINCTPTMTEQSVN